LAVIDILSKKFTITLISDSKSDEEDETDQTTTAIEHNYADSEVRLIEELELLIKNLRKIVKLFQNSPTKFWIPKHDGTACTLCLSDSVI
jgi:biotin-(acetyl-CoA carboxylase) ligase